MYKNTYLIVGLGNPGKEYDLTRHNIGFMSIDYYLSKNNLNLTNNKFNGEFLKTSINDKDVILAKPLTYMNLSGNFIRDIINFYKIDINNILIIYDDMDLEICKLRLRNKGSAGGHNGIKSIISNLGTDGFKRLKIGIGKPIHNNIIDYVIGKFTKEELEQINQIYPTIENIINDFINKDFTFLMNKYN